MTRLGALETLRAVIMHLFPRKACFASGTPPQAEPTYLSSNLLKALQATLSSYRRGNILSDQEIELTKKRTLDT